MVTDRIKEIVICLIIFCLGFGAGSMFEKQKSPAVTKAPEQKMETTTKTSTSVNYVAKTNPIDADVEVTNFKPTVSVNGKKYEFQTLPTETKKFDSGKVTVEQGYSLKIDIPKETIPKWGMDIGYSNHGYKVGVERNFSKNVAAYIEGTPITRVGKDKYYGVGIKVRF